MQAAVLLYPGCSFFEIALAAETLAAHMPVRYFTPDGRRHAASNGTSIEVDGDIKQLEAEDAGVVLVPGGDPRALLVPEVIAASALQARAEAGSVVAGICAGNLVMAASGLLRGRRGTHNYTAEHASPEQVATTARYWEGLQFVRADLVQDGNLITSQPWAYRRYAAQVARAVGVLSESEASFLENYVANRAYHGGA